MKIKYKRLAAYFIDIFLVTAVVGLICNSSLMTKQMDKYKDANTRLEEKSKEIIDTNNEDAEDVLNDMKAIIYDVNHFGTVYNLVDIIAVIGYFGVFQYFNKGQTIGKKVLKIKVVSKNDEKLPLINLILRTIILYGLIFTTINMVSTQFLKINGFYRLYSVTNILNTFIEIALYFMILFRKDERGLHDIISSSKVTEE